MTPSDRLPTLHGIETALELIRCYVPETPLVRSEVLLRAFGCDLWLKNEGVTVTFSFKVRGAANDLIRARSKGMLKGVVASSSGNHGLAVAWLAGTLGLSTHIFMSQQASDAKACTIALLDATVHRIGADIDYARVAAIDYADQHGLYFVYDGTSLDVMEGAATMALEVAHRLEGIDALLIPAGGSILSAGSAFVMKTLQPPARTIGFSQRSRQSMHEASTRRRGSRSFQGRAWQTVSSVARQSSSP